MRFLDFFFAINSKSRWPNEKGDIFYGVIGYSFPVTFVIFLLNQLVKRAISISLPFVLLLFLIIAILVFIYLLYRRNHYGDRIINTFEQTKFNKWYYILPICFGLQLAVLAFIAILYFYFGLIWRKSAVSETIKTKKSLDLTNMSIFDLYFYIWSKGNFVSCRGWILSGVFGFFLPLLFTLSLINLFLKKYHIPILDNTIVFWSILSILLISIYFYYRHNGRGEKVIDYYEKSKYNKWYNLLLLHIAFVVSYVSIFLLIIELLE